MCVGQSHRSHPPERIAVKKLDERDVIPVENSMQANIETLIFTGDRYEARFRLGEMTFVGYVPVDTAWHEGQVVRLEFPSKDLSVWPG